MFCNFVKDFQLQQAKGRMISFCCESSCPSGPCMSPFCCSPLNAEFTNLRLVKSHLREFTKGAAFLPHSHHPNFLPNTGLQMSKFKSRFPGNNSNQCIAMDYKYDAVSGNPNQRIRGLLLLHQLWQAQGPPHHTDEHAELCTQAEWGPHIVCDSYLRI